MKQIIVLPHENASVAGTLQVHPIPSHNQLTLGRSATFPSVQSVNVEFLYGNILVLVPFLTTFGLLRPGTDLVMLEDLAVDNLVKRTKYQSSRLQSPLRENFQKESTCLCIPIWLALG